MIDLLSVFLHLVPGAKCVVWENDYNKTVWEDDRPMPSEAEVEATIPIVEAMQKSQAEAEEAQIKIAELEAKSLRALREIALGKPESKTYLQSIDAEILVYREKL